MKRYIRSTDDNTFIGDRHYKYQIYKQDDNHYYIVDVDDTSDRFHKVDEASTEAEARNLLRKYVNNDVRTSTKIEKIWLYLSKTESEGRYELVGDHIEVSLNKPYSQNAAIMRKKIRSAEKALSCKIADRRIADDDYVIYQDGPGWRS